MKFSILTELLNLTCQIGALRSEDHELKEFLSGTPVENRHGAAWKPYGFAGSPHGVRSRKVL